MINECYNTARRLPIVFCLDISPSMSYQKGNDSSSIELLNGAVSSFINNLKQNTRTRGTAEIAFVTFGQNIELSTDFVSVRDLENPSFSALEKGGTMMSKAVLESIKKIEYHRNDLLDKQINCYTPFLVMVTDGDPDNLDDSERYKEAVEKIESCCSKEMLIPFVIGIGEHVDQKTLNNYSKGFTNGFFHIKGNILEIQSEFDKTFEKLKQYVHWSVSKRGREAYMAIQNDIRNIRKRNRDQVLADIAGM